MDSRIWVVRSNQLLIESAEARAARTVAIAYNQARRELTDEMLQRWVRLQAGAEVMTPSQLLEVYRKSALVRQIDDRLQALERENGVILRDVISSSSELAYEQVERELNILPRYLRDSVRPFSRVDTAMVERFFPPAFRGMQDALHYTGVALDQAFRAGLIRGESFPDLVKRIMGSTDADGEIWRRGRTSAMLGVRRTTIHANNAARVDYVRQARDGGIPELQKQVVASIQANTTDCCLRAHGQIQPVNKPFELDGEPRFADEMMHTPFHWNCRSSVAAYHPVFERGNLTTASLRATAAAELHRRQ